MGAGIAASRIRLVPLPIDTDRTGPDNGRVLIDPAIVRFLVVVEMARVEWHDALTAYLAAFEPAAKVSLTFLFLDPPSPQREAQFQAVLATAVQARTANPPMLMVEFQPAVWALSRDHLCMHDIAIGPPAAPWPVDELIASAGIARVDADSRMLREAAENTHYRARLARRQRRQVIAGSGIAALTPAFKEALDEVISTIAPISAPAGDDVLYVISGTAEGAALAASVATIEGSRALEGRVVAHAVLDDAVTRAATQRYIAVIPAGCLALIRLGHALGRRAAPPVRCGCRRSDAQ